MIWRNEWPVVKAEKSEGRMIWQGLGKPFPETQREVPETSDDFNKTSLGKQWMWNFQPRNEMWSLQEHPGYLRLYAFKPIAVDKIETAGNTLLQRNYRYKNNTAVAKFDLSGMRTGQSSGLLHASGRSYVGIWVSEEDGKRFIKIFSNKKIEVVSEITYVCNNIWFQSNWNFEFINSFFYSLDGVSFKEVGERTKLIGKDYIKR